MNWVAILFPVWLCYRFPLFLESIGPGTEKSLLILFFIIYWKIMLGRRIWDIGFPLKGQDILKGYCWGGFCVTAVIFLLIANDVLVLKGHSFYFALLIKGYLYFFLVSVEEELIFRGFLIGGLQGKKEWKKIVFSAAVFTWAHTQNPNFHMLGCLNIFLAGILLALLYLKENNLSYGLGFHWAWNFFQGSLFGLPVSGYLYPGLIRLKGREFARDLHAFGIEGEFFCTVVLGLGILYCLLRNKKTRGFLAVKE